MTTSAQIKQGVATRKAIRRFIASYSRKTGVCPSLQEIAGGLGLASHNAVRHHLVQMRDAGEVTWQEGRSRTIRLVEPKAVKKAS